MKKICPLLKEECMEHGCEWYEHMVGLNPQTGQPMDEYKCAVKWLPVLLVENAGMHRQTAASVDKVASEIAKHHATTIAAMSNEQKEILLSTDPRRKLLPGSNGKQGGE